MSFKLRRAIKDAALTTDVSEALRILEGVPGDWRELSFAIAPDLTPKLRARLGGVCLRAGLIDDAARIMLRRDAPEDLPAVDAIVLDPQYSQPGGHHDPHDRFYLELLRKAGLSAAWVHPRAQSIEPPAGTADLGTLSRLPEFRLFPLAIGVSELTMLNRLFHVMFRQALPAGVRLIVVPTAFHTFIEGLASYVAELAEPPALLLGIHESYWAEPHLPQATLESFRAAFAKLRAIGNARVLVVAEAAPIAEGFRRAFGDEWEVVTGPVVVRGSEPSDAEQAPAEGGKAVVGFAGRSAEDRGVALLPDIAKRTLAQRSDISWRIQINPQRTPDLPCEAVGAALAREIEAGSVDFLPHRLDPGEYAALLRSIDIMVMPFNSEYQVRSSGLGPECLGFGIVMVAPEGSTMARLAADYDAGCVTFSERTPDAIAAAVDAAVENRAALCAKSAAAAERFGASDARRRVEQFIEAGRR